MADRQDLRERFEELARCTEPGQYATVSGEDVRAVLELIREAEAVSPIIKWMRYRESEDQYYNFLVCGQCSRYIDPGDKFCRNCGRPVKYVKPEEEDDGNKL